MISLEFQKRQKDRLSRKDYLDTGSRLKELEEDMVRLIDMTMYLEHTLHHQERMLNRLLHLMKEQASSLTSSASATQTETESQAR